MSCSEWFPATNLQKILWGIEKELPRTHKKNTFKRFFLQFKPPNFCSQVLCEMVFDEGFWFQQTASFVPPPVCKDVIYESMNGDGPCLAILRNALENSKVANTDWWNFGAPKLLWVMFRCGSYSSHYLMTLLFFCTDATKAMKFRFIQVVGGFAQIWGRFCLQSSIINLCQIGKKHPKLCVLKIPDDDPTNCHEVVNQCA